MQQKNLLQLALHLAAVLLQPCCWSAATSWVQGLQQHVCVAIFRVLSPLTSESHMCRCFLYFPAMSFLFYIQRLRQKKNCLTIMKLPKCNLGKISDLTLCVAPSKDQGSLSFDYIEA